MGVYREELRDEGRKRGARTGRRQGSVRMRGGAGRGLARAGPNRIGSPLQPVHVGHAHHLQQRADQEVEGSDVAVEDLQPVAARAQREAGGREEAAQADQPCRRSRLRGRPTRRRGARAGPRAASDRVPRPTYLSRSPWGAFWAGAPSPAAA